MARKRRRGGRRGFRVGKWINLAFKVGGAAVAASPAIVSIDLANPQNIPKNMLFNYTGYNMDNGVFNPQFTMQGVAAIVGGIVLAKIGGFLGKRF